MYMMGHEGHIVLDFVHLVHMIEMSHLSLSLRLQDSLEEEDDSDEDKM